MGGKKPLRRPLWLPTRATASNYYPLGLDGAGGAAKPLLRAPKKPAPLHGRLPAFSGAVDAFERARKCFLEWRYFFSIILSEFLKNRVALQWVHRENFVQRLAQTAATCSCAPRRRPTSVFPPKEEMCSILTSNSTWKQRESPCLPFTRWSGARSGGPGSAAVRTCPNPRPSLRWISPRKSEDLRRGGADET